MKSFGPLITLHPPTPTPPGPLTLPMILTSSDITSTPWNLLDLFYPSNHPPHPSWALDTADDTHIFWYHQHAMKSFGPLLPPPTIHPTPPGPLTLPMILTSSDITSTPWNLLDLFSDLRSAKSPADRCKQIQGQWNRFEDKETSPCGSRHGWNYLPTEGFIFNVFMYDRFMICTNIYGYTSKRWKKANKPLYYVQAESLQVPVLPNR